MDSQTLSYDVFYSEMQARLKWLLPQEVIARKPEFKVRSNRMHIVLDRITGSHYEICLRREYHEIALHFQSTTERNLERRRAFDPLLEELSKTLGYPVRSGKLENQGWMRIWIERPVRPVTQDLLDEYTGIFSRFITTTFPTLEMIYQNGA